MERRKFEEEKGKGEEKGEGRGGERRREGILKKKKINNVALQTLAATGSSANSCVC